MQQVIPFDEITPGATARLAVIEEVQYLCSRDFLMFYCEKNNRQAAQIWSKLSEDQLEEFSSMKREHKFSGKGQPERVVLTFQGILKLATRVGGENDNKYHAVLLSILQRFHTGDSMLDEEVEFNAPSSEAALQGLSYKRKREMGIAKLEAELQVLQAASRAADLANIATEHENEAKHLANITTVHENEARRLTNIRNITTNYNELCQNTVMDQRACMILKESFINTAMLQGVPAAAGAAPIPP
jgi:hypothetical protein